MAPSDCHVPTDRWQLWFCSDEARRWPDYCPGWLIPNLLPPVPGDFRCQVLEINDHPVQAVLDTVSRVMDRGHSGALECKKIVPGATYWQGPPWSGNEDQVLNRGVADPITATLTAVDDNYATL